MNRKAERGEGLVEFGIKFNFYRDRGEMTTTTQDTNTSLFTLSHFAE